MSKGSAPTLHLNWEGEELVISVKGTPASAKATRARVRAAKSVIMAHDVEALTEWILDLMAEAFPAKAVQTGAE
jgi:hypothetical protein